MTRQIDFNGTEPTPERTRLIWANVLESLDKVDGDELLRARVFAEQADDPLTEMHFLFATTAVLLGQMLETYMGPENARTFLNTVLNDIEMAQHFATTYPQAFLHDTEGEGRP